MVYQYTKPRGPIAAMYSSPGPACYSMPGLTGTRNHDPRSTHDRRAAWCFGIKHKDMESKERSPGPVHLPDVRTTRHGREGEPHYSLYGRPQDLKMYSYPPPGTYSPEKSGPTASPRAPSYSFGMRTQNRSADNIPSPNTYTLPPLVGGRPVEARRRAAPAYSLMGRSKIGGFDEDLGKTPGPCAYPVTSPNLYRRRKPAYSLTGRNTMPGDHTLKPGPGAHNPETVVVHKQQSPRHSFGIRHSSYSVPCFSHGDMD